MHLLSNQAFVINELKNALEQLKIEQASKQAFD